MFYSILKEISNENSKNKKKEILANYLKNLEEKEKNILKEILILTYDPRISFNIKKIPLVTEYKNIYTLEEALNLLKKYFIKEKIRGNEAYNILKQILSSLNERDAEIIKRIIKRDLKIGMNIKSINEVENIIYTHKYQGAVPFSPKKIKNLLNKNNEIIIQEKYDGMYLMIKCKVENKKIVDVECETRTGKKVHLPNKIKAYLLINLNSLSFPFTEDFVLIGELLLKNIDRYAANGAINSYFDIKKKEALGIKSKDTISINGKNISIKKFENLFYFVPWDIITYNEYYNEKTNKKYIERLEILKKYIADNNTIYYPNTIIIKNENPKETIEEIIKIYQKIIEKGGEGIIIKSPSIGYENKKPSNIIKFKPEADIDLEIIDYEYGNKDTKNEKYINRLICKSKDGKLIVTVSGMKETEMKYLTQQGDNLIGKIITVTGTGITRNKNKKQYSILHPRFKEIRNDKNEADSLERIKNIFKMSNLAEKIFTNNEELNLS